MEIIGFLSKSKNYWPNDLSSVVFVPGTNLKAINDETKYFIKNSDLLLRQDSDEIIEFLLEDDEIDKLVITGGEPTLQRDLREFIWELSEYGFKIKLETNGTRPDILEELLGGGLVDYLSVIVKQDLIKKKYQSLIRSEFDLEDIKESLMIMLSADDVIKEIIFHYTPNYTYPEDVWRLSKRIRGLDRFILEHCPLRDEKLMEVNYDGEGFDYLMRVTKRIRGVKEVFLRYNNQQHKIYSSEKVSLR